MATTSPSAAIVPVAPVFSAAERLALAGFLAGYSGLTRDAYKLDLRQYASWCHTRRLALFGARRADIECFAHDLEARGRARATITRRLCTIAGFYRYAVEEELLDHSPAVHVRRPRLDYESHAAALDRNELGGLLVAAGLGPPAEHALISLLALNGLRVSEATGADIEAMGIERGHRTLVITRKGGKVVTIPLAPRTARAIDLAVGERCQGPVFLAADGHRLDRTAPGGSSAGSPAAPESPSLSGRTPCGTPSSPPPWTPACRCATCRKPPPTPTRAPPCATTGPEPPSTATPPTSSPPTLQVPPDRPDLLLRRLARHARPGGRSQIASHKERIPGRIRESPFCTVGATPRVVR
jgi:integrase/recombinase XerD